MGNDRQSTSVGESGSIALLVAINRSTSRVRIGDLSSVLSNFYTLKMRIAAFEEEGLVDISLEMDPHKVIYVSLTEKGREVAELLENVLKFFPQEISPEDLSISMKYAVPLILLLHKRGKLQYSEVLEVFPNYGTIVKKLLPALESDKIIRLGRETEGYKPKTIELTSVGKMIATGLDEVYTLILE